MTITSVLGSGLLEQERRKAVDARANAIPKSVVTRFRVAQRCDEALI